MHQCGKASTQVLNIPTFSSSVVDHCVLEPPAALCTKETTGLVRRSVAHQESREELKRIQPAHNDTEFRMALLNARKWFVCQFRRGSVRFRFCALQQNFHYVWSWSVKYSRPRDSNVSPAEF